MHSTQEKKNYNIMCTNSKNYVVFKYVKQFILYGCMINYYNYVNLKVKKKKLSETFGQTHNPHVNSYAQLDFTLI